MAAPAGAIDRRLKGESVHSFPESFVWGTATAAHQVEGNNVGSDFWVLEHLPGTVFAEPSGDACDHLHRYPEDIALLSALGFNSYRFSIEWARIEPEPGHFSVAALDHYRRMLATCHEHGVMPCVTFHHFTSPRWLSADGGWRDPRTADRFTRYCERAASHLGDLIGLACTINEANIAMLLGVTGVLPPDGFPGQRELAAAAAQHCGGEAERFCPLLLGNPFETREVILEAHRKAASAIRGVRPGLPVGITLAMQDFQAIEGGEKVRDEARAQVYAPFLEAASQDDFLGVQTYSRIRFGPEGPAGPEPGVPTLVLGYEFWPEALGATIRYAASVASVPIYVTENGIGTDDDAQRLEYVRRALDALVGCIRDGIDVRGYFYWSLLDNFEWMHGYGPRFGLIEVDRTSQLRTPKPSAHVLGRIARANAFDATGRDA